MQVKVLEQILGANDSIAQENRELFQQKGVLVLNIMSSPGSGKTSIIERTVKTLGNQYNVGVIEGDITSTFDAEVLAKLDIPVVQVKQLSPMKPGNGPQARLFTITSMVAKRTMHVKRILVGIGLTIMTPIGSP